MRSTVKKLMVIFTVFCMLLASLPVQAASPVISKKAITLTVGKSTTLKVKNAKGKIKWKSSNSKIASVSKRGKVIGKKTGKAKITATVNKRNYNCTVIVKAARKVTKVTNVKLNKKNITLKAGKVYTLKASVSPSKASNKTLVWKSSNNSIASVNSKGVVSAKEAGTVTITATAKDGSKKKASCKVTVKKASKPASDKRVSKIIVSSKKSVNINGTLQLNVSVQPSELSKTFTWKSDNTKIATVSSTGLVKGVSAGTVKITVTTNDKWKDSISVYITVNKPQNTPTIVLVVILNDGHRDVPVQYSQKMNGRRLTGTQASKIPIKVNVANVMPVIFASSLLSLPQMVASITGKGYGSGVSRIILEEVNQNNWFNPSTPWYSLGLVIYIAMLYFFAYFYTSISFNPLEVASNLKKSGGCIPGLRPGKPTEDYLAKVLSHMVVIGATALMIIVFIPTFFNGMFHASVSFGGTSIIIIVGVMLETLELIEAHMQVRKHQGFLTKDRREF